MPTNRIVSLVPSLSELVCGVGLEHKLLGCTKFCVQPANLLKTKTIVGGTKNANLSRIYALKPDLILAAKEENIKEQVEALAKDFRVEVTDIKSMTDMAPILNTLVEAGAEIKPIDQLLTFINQHISPIEPAVSALYLIWQKPFMSIGGDTYISSMMLAGGFQNVLAHIQRYPEVSLEQIRELNPHVILLSSEPFPFVEKHRQNLENQTGIPCHLVNGEAFSWYDSRLEAHLQYITNLHQRLLSA